MNPNDNLESLFVLLIIVGGVAIIVYKIMQKRQSAKAPAPQPPGPPQPAAPQIPNGGVLRQFASGGFADIYLTEIEASGRKTPAAVKILRAVHLDNPEIVQRFGYEGEVLRRVREAAPPETAALIPYYIADGRLEASGQPYLVMEFLDGEPLDVLIKAGRPLSDRNIAAVMRDVCATLSATHAAGFAHLDVKPRNILVTKQGDQIRQAKLLDFGAAVEYEHGKAAFKAGRFFTLPYASPEHRQGTDVTPRSDLYSLGIILLEMATGQSLSGKAVPATFPDHISPSLRALISPLLERDPTARPVSADDVRQQFLAVPGHPTVPAK